MVKPFQSLRKSVSPKKVSTSLRILGGDSDPHIDALDFALTIAASYGQEVAQNRALPDFMDGLLPVHRRVIWVCQQGNFTPTRPPRKTAKIIGSTLGDFHPHGDAPISGAITTMTKLPIPIMDGTISSFASPYIQGSETASPRYTETRLTPYGATFVDERYLPITPLHANYDDTNQEPHRLPALLPHILLTRLSGIAFGISTDIPPFTPESVAALLKAWFEKGPQTAQQCADILEFNYTSRPELVSSTVDVAKVFQRGHGQLKFAPKFVHEVKDKTLRIVACPPDLTYSAIVARVMKANVDFAEMQDQSTADGFDIRIKYKKGQDPKALEETLHALLTKSVRIRWVVTDRKSATDIDVFATSLPALIARWVRRRIDLEEKSLRYLQSVLQQREDKQRLHLFLFENREAVKKVWDSPNPQKSLVTLGLTEEQAKALCAAPVRSLFRVSANDIEKELRQIQKERSVLLKKQKQIKKTTALSLAQTFSELASWQ